MRSFAFALAALALSACATNTPPDFELAGTSWVAERVGGSETAVRSIQPTLTFTSPARINGETGCTCYGGRYEAWGSRLEVRALVAPQLGCTDHRDQEQHNFFIRALADARSFRVENGELIISSGTGLALRLRRAF